MMLSDAACDVLAELVRANKPMSTTDLRIELERAKSTVNDALTKMRGLRYVTASNDGTSLVWSVTKRGLAHAQELKLTRRQAMRYWR